MTPRELYLKSLESPESISNDVSILMGCYYDHIKESGIDLGTHETLNAEMVEIRMLKDFCYDGRRIWRLATVWFDKKPIMVIQNAGREGDDHAKRFITDVGNFKKMVSYIRYIYDVNNPDEEDIFSENDEGLNLIEFYGQKLGGYFQHY
jgi:hypothetical protein